MTNDLAVEVLSDYFGPAFDPDTVDVDAFVPRTGWFPVTRDSLFTEAGAAAARKMGVDVFAVSIVRRGNYGRVLAKRTADFRIDDVVR